MGKWVFIVLLNSFICLTWADRVIENFETPSLPTAWTFSNGAEFPGATGTLTQTVGQNGIGKAARLTADFSKGGNYVSATYPISIPGSAKAISFLSRLDAGARVVVRITDLTGQVLQYSLPRPLTALDHDQWFLHTFTLDEPSSHFGGANDGVLHQPIKQTAFLIEAMTWWRGGEKPTGILRLDFDDIVFLDSLQTDLDLTALPTVFAGTPTLENLGVNIHFTKNDPALDALANTGMQWLRMDIGWSGIERQKGVYNFSAFEDLYNSANARNLKLHLILDYSNSLYQNGPPTTALAIAAFRAFATATAVHFKNKSVQYEIWNEPNIVGFWNPPDPLAYAALCKEAIAGIHAGDPMALVSTAGTSEIDWPFQQKLMNAGGAVGANAIGVHPYRATEPETMAEEVLLLRSLVKISFPGTTPPLWETEWGYTATNFGVGNSDSALALQGRYDVREVLSAWSVGFPFIILYDLFNDGTDSLEPEHNFGLLNRDYTEKPAMTAIRTLTTRIKGFAAKGFLPARLSNVHALKLENASEILVILWLNKQNEFKALNATDSIPVAFSIRPISIWNHLGKSLNPPLVDKLGKYTWKAAYEPVYLLFSKSGSHIYLQESKNRRNISSPVFLETEAGWARDFSGRKVKTLKKVRR